MREPNDISILYKDGSWYRGPSKEWEARQYRFYPRGIWDLITNNMKKIGKERDKSEWAYWVFIKCRSLLIDGKRWPLSLEEHPELIAKNWLEHRWSILLYKIGIRDYKLFGPRGKITRDPFVYFLHCAVVNDWTWAIDQVSVPWYRNLPHIDSWHKFLKDPNEETFKRYEKWHEYRTSGRKRKDFVLIMDEYMEAAVKVMCEKHQIINT